MIKGSDNDKISSSGAEYGEYRKEGSKEHILQFFAYSHLPPHLQDVSKPFCDMAQIVSNLPRNPERTVALRKLLEAKDAAVRAMVAKDVV